MVDQTLFDWVKAHRQDKVTGTDRKAPVSAERMEISRLRAERARVKRGQGFSGKSGDALCKKTDLEYAFISRHWPAGPVSV